MELRNRVASLYGIGLADYYQTPHLGEGITSAWAQYTLIVNDRPAVQSKLKDAGVPSVVYYPKSLTQQGGYRDFPIVKSGVRVSDDLPSKVLSLPMHPYLTEGEVDKIIAALGTH